tara:strand:- start:4717 stop:5040 length:324 start_codon:yes stop_codon:yes gene_type:complete
MINLDLPREIYLVLTTERNENSAHKLAKILLEERLIACATFKNIESHFWWEGKINKENEVQIIIKCSKKNVELVCKKISINHSYTIPELLCFPVSSTIDYYQWLSSL